MSKPVDLLSSILNSMDKPPVVKDAESIRLKKVQDAMKRQQQKEKEKLKQFMEDVKKKIDLFSNNETETKLVFPVMAQILRTVIHEVSEEAGMTSYSFGADEVDRYMIVYKKEFLPCDDELNALRRGEEWNDEKAKELAEQREREKLEEENDRKKKKDEKFVPNTDYKEKYQHLIGLEVAKEAARKTETNKQYGFVPSENKRDSRSIEQTLADIKNKKRQKMNDEKTVP